MKCRWKRLFAVSFTEREKTNSPQINQKRCKSIKNAATMIRLQINQKRSCPHTRNHPPLRPKQKLSETQTDFCRDVLHKRTFRRNLNVIASNRSKHIEHTQIRKPTRLREHRVHAVVGSFWSTLVRKRSSSSSPLRGSFVSSSRLQQ